MTKIFVLHVKHGYEARKEHIDKMMAKHNLPFEYILDGDIPDITPSVMKTYFGGDGEMSTPNGAVSCAYKHILACQRIIDRNLDGALVLEDDIVLFNNFDKIFGKSLEEFSILEDKDKPSIISYEDTRLRFVPGSKRENGRVLYPGPHDRFTGCIYVNNAAAQLVCKYAREEHIDIPIDLIHTRLIRLGLLNYYWVQPCIATQGSFTGKFSSSITFNRSKAFIWRLQRLYKKALYRLR